MPVSDTDNCKIHGKIAKADDLNFNILDNFIIINGAFGLVSLYLLAIDLYDIIYVFISYRYI